MTESVSEARSARELSGWPAMCRAAAFVGMLAVLALPPQRSVASEPAIATPKAPQSVIALLKAATRAVNRHDPAVMAEYAASGARGAFAWVAGRGHDWSGDVLPVPGDPSAPATFLAVFHAFHTCESDGDHVHRLVIDESGARWRLGAEIPETETLGLRIRDHAITAQVTPADHSVRFADTIAVEHVTSATGDDPHPAYGLIRISEDFGLNSLRMEREGPPVPFAQAGGVVAFVPPGDPKFKLSMTYGGRLEHSNGDYVHSDEAVIASYWYPHIARLPATLSLTATAPPGWTTVAQGEPTGSSVNADGSRTTSWRNDIPVSFFTLDMGRYARFTRDSNGIQLSVYLLSSQTGTAEKLANSSLNMLEQSLAFYQDVYGPFPYKRYSVVQTRGPFNGALEAYSFATFGPQTLPEYIPHELSHTWWGGLAPCTYTRSMWNEAMANYSDDLFRRSREQERTSDDGSGQESGRRERRRTAPKAYDAVPIRTAFDTEDDRHNAVGYNKGSQVLRVLEEQIGRSAMLKAMRLFVSSHRRGEAAEWTDFEAAVARTTGEDMGWFFTQWLDRAGTPVIALSNLSVREEVGAVWLDGHVRQTGPVYRLKLPVRVELRSGSSVSGTIEVRDADSPFSLRLTEAPASLRLDPDGIFPLNAGGPQGGRADPLSYSFP